MIKVYNNGKYFFFTLNNKDITLPLPGDLIVLKEGEAFIILDNSFYERDGVPILEITLYDGSRQIITKGGSAKLGVGIRNINFLTSDPDDCKIYRGTDKIYPIGPIYKVRNKITKLYYWGIELFKNLKAKIGL
tara:strand:+ start:202 stop:600 length:399 start_codon:yes stop_codon:yes gene_type:complete